MNIKTKKILKYTSILLLVLIVTFRLCFGIFVFGWSPDSYYAYKTIVYWRVGSDIPFLYSDDAMIIDARKEKPFDYLHPVDGVGEELGLIEYSVLQREIITFKYSKFLKRLSGGGKY